MTATQQTVETTAATLARDSESLLRQGFRLALVAGHDDRDALRAVYLWTAAGPDRRVELHLPIDRDRPTVPSLAALSYPAGRFEREMHDLYGIHPTDHPLPRRRARRHRVVADVRWFPC